MKKENFITQRLNKSYFQYSSIFTFSFNLKFLETLMLSHYTDVSSFNQDKRNDGHIISSLLLCY